MCKTISFKSAQLFTLLACWLMASVAFGQISGTAFHTQKSPGGSGSPAGYKAPKVEYTPNWGPAGAESSLLANVYVTNGGQPWGISENISHMDVVFGAGNWSPAAFSTVNLTDLFSAATNFIWIEGGDGLGAEMSAFVSANQAALQNWVNGGGCLFLNAATWDEVDVACGFGGVTIDAQYSYEQATASIAAGQGGNAIFTGPNTPVGSSWSGNWFTHGIITGPYGTALINSPSGPVLTEKFMGSGHVYFSAMTASYWQSPNLEATNLWRNIIEVCSMPECTPAAPTGQVVTALTPTTATVAWTVNCDIDQSVIQHSRKNGASWLAWVSVGVAGPVTTKTLTGLSANRTYRWRVRSHYVSTGAWIMSNPPYPTFTTPASLLGGGGWGEKGNGILALVATPNPASGSTTISLGIDDFENLEQVGQLRIHSFDGRLVFEKNGLSVVELENYELDLTGLNAGIYLLSVSTESGVAVQKLVVE